MHSFSSLSDQRYIILRVMDGWHGRYFTLLVSDITRFTGIRGETKRIQNAQSDVQWRTPIRNSRVRLFSLSSELNCSKSSSNYHWISFQESVGVAYSSLQSECLPLECNDSRRRMSGQIFIITKYHIFTLQLRIDLIAVPWEFDAYVWTSIHRSLVHGELFHESGHYFQQDNRIRKIW